MALVPPVQKDGFSYAGDSLYCEASNLNRHRRATLPELQNHFNGKDTENRPAHWYEAQLLHYGLAPSKVKGTAHKRLFDAVMGGNLAVPPQIQKIEADLKKAWAKKEREAKKMLKESAAAKPPAKGTKRKADQVSTSTSVNVNVNVSISSTGVIEVSAAQAAAKKAKAAPKTTAKEKKVTPSAKPDALTAGPKEKKATAKKATAPSTTAKDVNMTAKIKAAAAAPKEKKVTAPKTAATEKRAAPAKSTTAAAKPAKPAAKAKGAASKAAQHPNPASTRSQGEDDDPPPPYSEYDPGLASGWRGSELSVSPSSPRRRIGLLNGRYSVVCEHAECNFPQSKGRLSLIATLDGNTLWLNFDLGVATGMMKVPRPYEVNTEHSLGVLWRGNALPFGADEYELFNIDTLNRAGPANGLFFMGDGHIRGRLRYGSTKNYNNVTLEFDAYRRPDQSMTSEISPTQARHLWASLEAQRDSYSESASRMDEEW